MMPELSVSPVLDPRSNCMMPELSVSPVLDPRSNCMMHELSVSPVLYPRSKCMVPEHYRIAVNRLRLSSHYLKIETGRWSRIPLENRMFTYNNDIQTDQHDCY